MLCNSLSSFNEKIIGISFCSEKDKSVYLPFSESVLDLLNKIFQNSDILKIGLDIKDQIKILPQHNVNEIKMQRIVINRNANTMGMRDMKCNQIA